jgi:tRNA (guanine6-N2)-methyltransferase
LPSGAGSSVEEKQEFLLHRIFAIATRGLEPVCADEMGRLPGLVVDSISYRRIAAACDAPLEVLLSLRTVDDVFLDIAGWSGVGRQRSSLVTLHKLSTQLDLFAPAAMCSTLRPVRKPPSFSVTANFVGKRNFSSEEIKQAVSEGILASHVGWAYNPDDAVADLNVRVFIEHDSAHVGVRIGQTPLHRRPYKRMHVPGSLKPSVAAALVFLSESKPGMRVLDPCCGAGTILIEAALSRGDAVGGDIDRAVIGAASSNAQAADVAIQLCEWDAQQLPIAAASVDRILCNLPWGREVEVATQVKALYRQMLSQMHKVLSPNGRMVLLTNAPHLVNLEGYRCEEEIEISLFGQTPTILLLGPES